MKKVYIILRSVVMTIMLTIVGLYLLSYIAVSLPFVQNTVRRIAEKELSVLLGGNLEIGEINISPFNKVVISDVELRSPVSDEKVVKVDKLGAGISLWRLCTTGRLEFTYAEIVGLDARISQSRKGGPLNIQFLIDALKSKDDKSSDTKFDLAIRSIVIRKSSASFDRIWSNKKLDKTVFDPNHIEINNLRGDISVPRLKNDSFLIDVRRISFEEKSGFELVSLSGVFDISDSEISVADIQLELPGTLLQFNDIKLPLNGLKNIGKTLKSTEIALKLNRNKVTLSDFRCFVPKLAEFNSPYYLTLDVDGNSSNVDLHSFYIESDTEEVKINLSGRISNIGDKDRVQFSLPLANISVRSGVMSKLLSLANNRDEKLADTFRRIGSLDAEVSIDATFKSIVADGFLRSDLGRIDFNVATDILKRISVSGNIETQGFDIGRLLNDSRLGNVVFNTDADVVIADKKNVDGTIDVEVERIDFKGTSFENITVYLEKQNKNIYGNLSVSNSAVGLTAEIEASFPSNNTSLSVIADVQHLNPASFGVLSKYPNHKFSGKIDMDIAGTDIYTSTGEISLYGLSFVDGNGEGIELGDVFLKSLVEETGRKISIESDFIDGSISGIYDFKKLPLALNGILAEVAPEFVNTPVQDTLKSKKDGELQNFTFHFKIKDNNEFTEFFSLPFRLVYDINLSGRFDEANGVISATLDAPYLQQGKDKLIRNSNIDLAVNTKEKLYSLYASSLLPGKKGDVNLTLKADALDGRINSDISWRYDRKRAFKGNVSLSALLDKDMDTKKTVVNLDVNPSQFVINDTIWDIDRAHVRYSDKHLEIGGIRVHSKDDQFVLINGKASELSTDSIIIRLNNMNLDYIFETLNINYVTFGGDATGTVCVSSLFTKHPLLSVPKLDVKHFTYNGGLLGDAVINSKWHNEEKKVSIFADIKDGEDSSTRIDGGIWIARDSLSFDCYTKKVNIQFLKPFLEAFTTDVSGRASGHAHLFGTFKDIDLEGDIFADKIRMRVDYTNTYYSGSDSMHLRPGRIDIKDFRLYDRNGNSALLNGWVSHHYFHEPKFDFKITDARNFLSYDTDAHINPDWYGTIYGNGGCTISGVPGVVNILVDMSTAPNSSFTFVLNETEAADDYKFLSFSDKRKELSDKSAKKDSLPDFVRNFHKIIEHQNERPSIFNMDLRVTATPDAQMIIVMDPIGGDKIKGTGSGALQIGYSSETDEMSMYGKYTLDKGLYNFTLQDIILKDFIIRPGSSISFNGDPLDASLSIDAVYRVNTNLSDLDKSFSTDKDLNRTNVPVEAVLKVSGSMQSPDINFDIELPTLTQDVERKVKSIVSTEDMMSRQIIYLLALNRFYTPEYMGGGSNNNELASVASTTISSQLSNMLGQLSDNWSFSPYFRTDKGDFSDIEVDLALSSTLLNNRLLLNGNFGYRDRATSSTTFVGDFDIEYLLNRSGTLRLKAYNHYNDQNYYLKSALTTQGIGVMYKHDFDRWFQFLRRRKKTSADSGQNGEKNEISPK